MRSKGLWFASAGLAVLIALPAVSQDTNTSSGNTNNNNKKKSETVAKPLTEKEKKKKEAALKKELETPWRKWLDEDVAYIITDEERKAFHSLSTDEEREAFVEQFWIRRDPTPDTVENEYKEEHYRRIAYANEHYASGVPGWKTDRGRIYIEYGPPDEIDAHPSGGSYDRPTAEGGGTTSTYPFEDWRYRYIEGIGSDINIEFVDTTMSGEYHMTMDPSEKDALLYVPGAGLTDAEAMGLADKSQRFQNTDGTHLNPNNMYGQPNSYNEFERINQFAKLQAPPAIKYPDLEAQIGTRITYNILPMATPRVDYVRVTDSSVLTLITIQFECKDLDFQLKDGVDKAQVNLLGRISTMTRRPVTTFEKSLEVPVPPDLLQQYVATQKEIYQEAVPLAPGRYKLNVVAKDTVAGTLNNYEVALDVPHFDDEKLASSSLILADTIEKLPTKSIGGGMFAIGDTKVRPRLGDKFASNEHMGVYLQVYNFIPDEKTHKPNGSIEYEIDRVGSNEKVLDATDDLAKVPNASASQVTIEKTLDLKLLAPGTYTVKIKATDKANNQSVSQQANFTVVQKF